MKAMVWLTWRQHRWALAATAGLVLFAAPLLISLDGQANGGMPLSAFYAQLVQTAFGAVIGAFWGAPLVAREFEDRTNYVAWGQDVAPERWLAGKVAVLAVAAVLLAVPMGIGDGYPGEQNDQTWAMFEADPLLQVGYVLFGLAAGVLAGLLVRHTLTAMAFTLAAFVGVRMLLSLGARDHYLPTVRALAPVGEMAPLPDGAELVSSGYLDTRGSVMSVPTQCVELPRPAGCIRTNGGAQSYYDFQPVDRVPFFRVTEFVICLGLAVGLFAFAYLRLRRGWRPSRAHRRLS